VVVYLEDQVLGEARRACVDVAVGQTVVDSPGGMVTRSVWAGESMWKFLERELSDPMTSLAVIGERALNAEFPADLQARQVLGAIGSGERSHGAIEQRSGVPQTSLNRSLETLQEKGVVHKALPYSSRRNPKPPRYIVADPYLRFWLRFISPNLELIQRGRGDVVLERIRESWNAYRGRAIEAPVREAIERMLPDGRFAGARCSGSSTANSTARTSPLSSTTEATSPARVLRPGWSVCLAPDSPWMGWTPRLALKISSPPGVESRFGGPPIWRAWRSGGSTGRAI
jgi:DNA-binding transcriptional ArsR family regulator